MSDRFFLGQDESSHWYIVPASKMLEWNAWCDLDEEDERSWAPPEWAKEVGGSLCRVTFTDPVLE